MFYLTITQKGNSCWTLREVADVCFDECWGLGHAFQAAFSESKIKSKRLHPGWRLKNRRKHQTQQLVMMVSEMISTRTLQSPVGSRWPKCMIWWTSLLVWVAKAVMWLFWNNLCLHKGLPFIRWWSLASNSFHLSSCWLIAPTVIIKVTATQWAALQVGDYMRLWVISNNF